MSDDPDKSGDAALVRHQPRRGPLVNIPKFGLRHLKICMGCGKSWPCPDAWERSL